MKSGYRMSPPIGPLVPRGRGELALATLHAPGKILDLRMDLWHLVHQFVWF
jgi:hypothetical protein